MPCDHLKTLNLAKEGKLEAAHKLVQPHADQLSCLIHAYIHRVESDLSNADYWYRRAGVKRPHFSLARELDDLYRKINST